MNFDKLKSQRSHAKASLTRISNQVDANKDTHFSVLQFSNREISLKDSFNKYCSYQDEIEDLIGNALVLITDTEDRLDIEEKYYDTLSLTQNNSFK